ncbi:MAG: type II toxin-antitoxin system VapC family toxin [Nocardioidaceae bacterium]
MTLYFDTLALVKLVVREDGSELATRLWASRLSATSSILAYPEGRAALAAALRTGRLTARSHRKAVGDFQALHQELAIVGIDSALAQDAAELAESERLRGYDAVHLASALALRGNTTLITWDRDLGRAAIGRGCAVAPPPG